MRKQSDKELTWGDVLGFLAFLVMLGILFYLGADGMEKEAVYSERIGAAYASGQLSNIESVDGIR